MIGAILRWAVRSFLLTLVVRLLSRLFPALAYLLRILRR
jgi:hypothetical protein